MDNRFAAHKVLGNQIKQTTPAQRDAFVDVFTEYMVSPTPTPWHTSTSRPSRSSAWQKSRREQHHRCQRQRERGRQAGHLPRVAAQEQQDRRMESLRHGCRRDQPALRQKQNELGGLIRQNGIDAVIAQLREHNAAAGDQVMIPEQTKAPAGQRSVATPRRLVAGRPARTRCRHYPDSAGLALLVKWAWRHWHRGATPTLVGASNDFLYAANLYGWPASFSFNPLTTEDHKRALKLKRYFLEVLPLSEVHVSGDGSHYQVIAVGDMFDGMNRSRNNSHLCPADGQDRHQRDPRSPSRPIPTPSGNASVNSSCPPDLVKK